jgi:hypothetical protein
MKLFQCPETGTAQILLIGNFFAICSILHRQVLQLGVDYAGDEIASSSNLRCSKDKFPTPARLEFLIWSPPVDLIARPEDWAKKVLIAKTA